MTFLKVFFCLFNYLFRYNFMIKKLVLFNAKRKNNYSTDNSKTFKDFLNFTSKGK